MELLSKKAEATFNRLVRYAGGRRALVTTALAKYNSGEIDDLLAFIDAALPTRRPDLPPQPNPHPILKNT